MKNYLEIGVVPADEQCQQVGTPDYDHVKARKECQCYINQLRRQFGNEPEGAGLFIKSSPHDFGNYLEVHCRYYDERPDAVAYAMKCEGEAWTEWDEQSKLDLDL